MTEPDGEAGPEAAAEGADPRAPAPPPGFIDLGAYPTTAEHPAPSVPAAPRPTSSTAGRRRRRWPLAVVALLVAGVVAAVVLLTGGGDGGDEATTSTRVRITPGSPGAVYTAWVQAVAGDDLARACQLVSRATLDQAAVRTQPCETVVAEAVEERDLTAGATGRATKVAILAQAIDGDRATVTARIGTAEPDAAVVLVREDGIWKVQVHEDASPGGDTSIDAAEAAACELGAQTVEAAATAYLASTGEEPSSVDALVPDYLDEAPRGIGYSPSEGVTRSGPCA